MEDARLAEDDQATGTGHEKQLAQKGNDATMSQPAEDGSMRPLILFDLNGVLLDETEPYGPGDTRRTPPRVRPQVEQLLRLRSRFRLGIFTSSTLKTLRRGIGLIGAQLSANNKQLAHMGLQPLSRERLFDVLLHRDHCTPDPGWQDRPDGKVYDTLKPLKSNGLQLSRTLLVDNHSRKSLLEERSVLIEVQEWQKQPDGGVLCWQVLISQLLALPEPAPDMQEVAPRLTACVAAAAAAAAPVHAAIDAAAGGKVISAAARSKAVSAAVEVLSVALASISEVHLEHGAQLPSEIVGAAAAVAALSIQAALADGSATAGTTDTATDEGEASKGNVKKRKQAKRAQELSELLDCPGLPDSGAPLYWEPELREMLGLPLSQQGQEATEAMSALHAEVLAFAARCCPPIHGPAPLHSSSSLPSAEACCQAVRLVQAAARLTWPSAVAVAYGSLPTATALPGAQLNILLQGVLDQEVPHPPAPEHKAMVQSVQQQLLTNLKELGCTVSCHTGGPLRLVAVTKGAVMRGVLSPPPAVRPEADSQADQANGGDQEMPQQLTGDEQPVGDEQPAGGEHPAGEEQPAEEQQASKEEAAGDPEQAHEQQPAGDPRRTGEQLPAGVPFVLSVTQSHGYPWTTAMRSALSRGTVAPLRPLLLALKALLQDQGSGFGTTGGISSAALTAMVLAHLECEGLQDEELLEDLRAQQQGKDHGEGPPQVQEQGQQQEQEPEQGEPEGSTPLAADAAAMEEDAGAEGAAVTGDQDAAGPDWETPLPDEAAWMSYIEQLQYGDDQVSVPGSGPAGGYDLGLLLLGFLKRFGHLFSYPYNAVNVLDGGVVEQPHAAGRAQGEEGGGAGGWVGKHDCLVVHDPQVAAVNMAGGVHATRMRQALQGAINSLTLALQQQKLKQEQQEAQQGSEDMLVGDAAVSGEMPLLSSMMRVQQVLNPPSLAELQQQQQQRRQAGREGRRGKNDSRASFTPQYPSPSDYSRSAALLRVATGREPGVTALGLLYTHLLPVQYRVSRVDQLLRDKPSDERPASGARGAASAEYGCEVTVLDAKLQQVVSASSSGPNPSAAAEAAAEALVEDALRSGVLPVAHLLSQAASEVVLEAEAAVVAMAVAEEEARKKAEAAAAAAAAEAAAREAAERAAARAEQQEGDGLGVEGTPGSKGEAGKTAATPPAWESLYPVCRALIVWLNQSAAKVTGPRGGVQNERHPKTVLHEWAQRVGYTLVCRDLSTGPVMQPEEGQGEAAAGQAAEGGEGGEGAGSKVKPREQLLFCEASVCTRSGSLLYGPMMGKAGRTKKEMQAEACAALLEHLITNSGLAFAEFARKDAKEGGQGSRSGSGTARGRTAGQQGQRGAVQAGGPRSAAGATRGSGGAPRIDAGAARGGPGAPRSDVGARGGAVAPRSDAGTSRSGAAGPRSDAGAPRSSAGAPRADAGASRGGAGGPRGSGGVPGSGANQARLGSGSGVKRGREGERDASDPWRRDGSGPSKRPQHQPQGPYAEAVVAAQDAANRSRAHARQYEAPRGSNGQRYQSSRSEPPARQQYPAVAEPPPLYSGKPKQMYPARQPEPAHRRDSRDSRGARYDPAPAARDSSYDQSRHNYHHEPAAAHRFDATPPAFAPSMAPAHHVSQSRGEPRWAPPPHQEPIHMYRDPSTLDAHRPPPVEAYPAAPPVDAHRYQPAAAGPSYQTDLATGYLQPVPVEQYNRQLPPPLNPSQHPPPAAQRHWHAY